MSTETSKGWREAQCRHVLDRALPDLFSEVPPNDHAIRIAKLLGLLEMTEAIGQRLGKNEPSFPPDVALILNSELQCLAYRLGAIYSVMMEGLRNVEATPEATQDETDRISIGTWCAVALQGILPQCRDGDEIVMIPLPARLVSRIVDAISALGAGEQPALFTPARTGRHSQPYTWDRMRVRACQHVEFLVGKGNTKEAALATISLAIGVPSETLRKWREGLPEIFSQECKHAREAGRIAAGEVTNPVDAYADAVFDQLKTEPLEQFGAKYRAAYGKRHNPHGDDRPAIAIVKPA
jgi:hypothetical protein